MVARRRSQVGFTLIEALLATTLMALLMLTASYVYNYISQNWDRQKGQFAIHSEKYININLVSKVLINSYAKLVYPKDPYSENPQQALGYYFLGRDEGFTAVSSNSVQFADFPAVYRVFREPQPNTPGYWQLVYEEAPLTKFTIYHAEQELNFNFRRILLSDLPALSFEYQGFLSIQERTEKYEQAGSKGGEPDWYKEYDSFTTKQHPQAIEIIMPEFTWSIEISDNFELTYSQTTKDV